MSGYLLLAGGAEFGGRMALADRAAIAAAGGPEAPVAIIPAAAAPDDNAERAGRNAERWFRGLGVWQAESLPIVDRASADDPASADRLEHARLIYLLGGFPAHLAATLKESRAWQAMRAAWRAGAVVGGSSAGAMVLCSDYFDPIGQAVDSGLGLIPNTLVIPHHDTYGTRWLPTLRRHCPRTLLMGIDEETAALTGGGGALWRVYGKGRITLYRGERQATFAPDHPFDMADWKDPGTTTG